MLLISSLIQSTCFVWFSFYLLICFYVSEYDVSWCMIPCVHENDMYTAVLRWCIVFSILTDYLSASTLDYWERSNVFNYSCGFFCFSFQWYSFSVILYSEALLLDVCIFRIVTSSVWIDLTLLLQNRLLYPW